MIEAKIIADSIGPSGKRLTTFELTYPRFIHSELMTHRALSKNSASSRAIPVKKMRQRIRRNPAMPVSWGQNQKGMQASTELSGWRRKLAIFFWLLGCRFALFVSWVLEKLGVHKQIANRVTEPWMHMTVVVTATEWANFFHLRFHKAAQPEFQELARIMYSLYKSNEPKVLKAGEWHLPYIRQEDWDELDEAGLSIETATKILVKVSTGRCARTSYVNQDGYRDLDADINLHDRLYQPPDSNEPGHWSPFEHVAQALETAEPSGNIVGFKQYRKMFPNENHTDMPVR
jgi:hypothetical protein